MITPRRYLPSLASLLALEALDRLGSASAAAEELSLTQSAISRQLQVLEGQMGVPLLLRDRKQLRLTPAARDYVGQVRSVLQLLAQASLKLRANPTGGSLNLAILPAFGVHWLAPRLADFAGTKLPIWAIRLIKAVWRRNADLPDMFGPVMIKICWSSLSM